MLSRIRASKDPEVIKFFDRDDKQSLPKIIGELAREMMGPGKSVMVHVEGTRSLSSVTPVQKMSGAFIDMALKTGVPVIACSLYRQFATRRTFGAH